MSRPAIKVEGLWKQYILGARENVRETFREMLVNSISTPFRRLRQLKGNVAEEERFWALTDVNLEVQPGEVVGIIGRNGAGKTTLLKILSRITPPTRGRIEICGRVASLLEVGTGFHPELTGRENIYLNGVILGMTRREIQRKFDDIVGFAEVEKFLDTPVKRYSSGMYVRLAFAVAAHVEPDILLVDEVLAVGDAAFQKKCLGEMRDAAKAGRTVLFVSHNMQAVRSLCHVAIQLEDGCVVDLDVPESVISRYLSVAAASGCEKKWSEASAPGNGEIKLIAVRTRFTNGSRGGVYPSSKGFCVELEFVAKIRHQSLCIGFDLVTPQGTTVLRSYQTDSSPDEWPDVKPGHNRWYCTVPGNLLNAGTYFVCPKISVRDGDWIVDEEPVMQLQIALDHGASPPWTGEQQSIRPGLVAPILRWDAV